MKNRNALFKTRSRWLCAIALLAALALAPALLASCDDGSNPGGGGGGLLTGTYYLVTTSGLSSRLYWVFNSDGTVRESTSGTPSPIVFRQNRSGNTVTVTHGASNPVYEIFTIVDSNTIRDSSGDTYRKQ